MNFFSQKTFTVEWSHAECWNQISGARHCFCCCWYSHTERKHCIIWNNSRPLPTTLPTKFLWNVEGSVHWYTGSGERWCLGQIYIEYFTHDIHRVLSCIYLEYWKCSSIVILLINFSAIFVYFSFHFRLVVYCPAILSLFQNFNFESFVCFDWCIGKCKNFYRVVKFTRKVIEVIRFIRNCLHSWEWSEHDCKVMIIVRNNFIILWKSYELSENDCKVADITSQIMNENGLEKW